ncbi:hypothetical protein, partial [Lacticaseibacillus chiayiensis]|uniref:hypothetical protein n=1 Tax=Lacticaseibacillus chiayiensis TaxID=2100821 RepID=UPI0010268CEA
AVYFYDKSYFLFLLFKLKDLEIFLDQISQVVSVLGLTEYIYIFFSEVSGKALSIKLVPKNC